MSKGYITIAPQRRRKENTVTRQLYNAIEFAGARPGIKSPRGGEVPITPLGFPEASGEGAGPRISWNVELLDCFRSVNH